MWSIKKIPKDILGEYKRKVFCEVFNSVAWNTNTIKRMFHLLIFALFLSQTFLHYPVFKYVMNTEYRISLQTSYFPTHGGHLVVNQSQLLKIPPSGGGGKSWFSFWISFVKFLPLSQSTVCSNFQQVYHLFVSGVLHIHPQIHQLSPEEFKIWNVL